MKKIICILILLTLSGQIFGQTNLVPNPSFETYTSCPTAFSQVNKAPPWYATNNSSELFNLCGTNTANAPNTWYGFQAARTGSAYAGQYFINGYGNDYREYIQVPLTTSLTAGNCYFAKYYVNCVNKVINYACNNFGAHLSTGGYSTNFTGFPATSFTPQIYLVNNPIVTDTLNWIEIGGIFTAIGGEKYLTIGNFKNDANTDTLRTGNGYVNYVAYYYIDDVSVEQITAPVWQLRDTMIISGDSVLIGPLYSGLNCSWYDMSSNLIGTGSGIWVKPTITTSYVFQQTICNNIFYDTMTVYVGALGIKDWDNNARPLVYPQPADDILKIKFNGDIRKEFEFHIINVFGTPMDCSETKSNEDLEFDVSEIPNGIYFLRSGQNIIRKIVINR